MKHIQIILSIALVGCFAMACTTGELKSELSPRQEVEFSISMDTKASRTMTSGMFSDGDAISVNALFRNGRQSSVYSIQSDNISLRSDSPLCWPADEDEGFFYAYYPSDCPTEDGTVSFTLPTGFKQYEDLNSGDFLYACAGGKRNDPKVQLSFSHLVSLVEINVFYPGGISPKAVLFDALKHNLSVNLLDGSFEATGKEAQIECMSAYNNTYECNGTWEAVVAPQTLSCDILLVMPDDKTYSFKITEPVELLPGSVYSINLDFDDPTIDGDKIKIISFVESWMYGGNLETVAPESGVGDFTVAQACKSPDGTRCRVNGWIGGKLDYNSLSCFINDESGYIFVPEMPDKVSGYFSTGTMVTLCGTVSHDEKGHPQLVNVRVEKLQPHDSYQTGGYLLTDFINSCTPSKVFNYYLEGTIVEVTDLQSGCFTISDGTATLSVLGCNNIDIFRQDIIPGSPIILIGFRSDYYGLACATDCSIQGITFNVEDIGSIAELLSKKPDSKYYRVSGNVSFISDTSYGRFYLEDASGTIFVNGVRDWTRYQVYFKEGCSVTVSGQLQSDGKILELANVVVESLKATDNIFATGTLTEKVWDKTEEGKVMVYHQITDNLRLCMIKDCWGNNTIVSGGQYDVRPYVWIWDTSTNKCVVRPQYIGYSVDDNTKVYVSDAAGFYDLYYGYGKWTYSDEAYFYWAVDFMAWYGLPAPYYDGNGTFYLGDWLFCVVDGTANGHGYSFGDNPDTFVCDGFDQ